MLKKIASKTFLLGSIAVFSGFNMDANATSLNEALSKAYNYNPQLKAERASVRSADEALSQAIAEWFPSVNFVIEGGNEKAKRAGITVSDDDTSAYRLDVQQPIFQGGGSMSRLKLAKNSILASREGLKNIEQQVLLQTVSAYMGVVRDQRILELSKRNQDVLEKHLKATKERFKLGEVTKTDVSQAKARLARSKSARLEAEGNLVGATTIYERFIGEVPVDISLPNEIDEVAQDLDELVAISYKSNPILKRAEYNELSAQNNISARKASLLPNLNLIADVNNEDGTFVSGGQELETTSIALNLRVPLYQSGAEYSRVREAKQTALKRHYDTVEIRNQLKESVIQAYHNLQVAKAIIESAQVNVDSAEIALEGVQQEAMVGSRTTLDVLDAEQELFEASIELIQAKTDTVISSYQLIAQIGQLNPKNLGLDVKVYDPKENYNKIKYKFIGF